MTTITLEIENQKIKEKYTISELELLVNSYIQSLADKKIELREIAYKDLPKKVQKTYDNRKNLNFVNY